MGKLLMMIVRSQWDRAAAIAIAAISGLVLLLGWFGVASTSYPAEQTPYIVSGGILGILLMGMAAILWLSADMRDEWRKLDELSDLLRSGAVESAALSASPDGAELPDAPPAAPKVVGPRTRKTASARAPRRASPSE